MSVLGAIPLMLNGCCGGYLEEQRGKRAMTQDHVATILIYPPPHPSGKSDGSELSVLHLPQVAGHIQQNTYQVEHSFH